MSEWDYVVSKQKINYEGLFDAKELFKLIDQFFFHLNYDKLEIKQTESVKPEGKYVEQEVEYYRKLSNYIQNRVHIKLILSDLKEVEVKKEKAKVKLNKGKVQLIIDGYMETDWEGMWETKPIYYVIRTVINKWVVSPITGQFKGELKRDISHFKNEVSAFLNLYRF